jgi:hypothetical protein
LSVAKTSSASQRDDLSVQIQPLSRFDDHSAVLGEKSDIARCLEGLAGLAGAQGRQERASLLFGAAEALRESIGAPVALFEGAGY